MCTCVNVHVSLCMHMHCYYSETDQRSSIVKFIIDCEYNHTAPSFVKSVVRNLCNLLGDESIHADSVHGESGGTAVFVQMSAKAHARLWEFCKDQSSLLAGLHILEVSTVDGAVVFNFRPTACSGEGKTDWYCRK